jgi:hypothetical protein
MRLPATETEYRNALIDAADVAIKRYRAERGEEDRFISQRRAERAYGQRQVREWIKRGLVKRTKHGANNSKVTLDRIELEATKKASR